MKILDCLSWVSLLCDQEQKEAAQNAYLPYDIIVNIFSRIPATSIFQWGNRYESLRSLTTTSSFVDMHLSRTIPVICFQYLTLPCESIFHVDISFADDDAKKITTRRFKFDAFFASRKRGSIPFLYGSYNGLLLFLNLCDDLVLYIWNPVTQSQTVAVSPSLSYTLRGFYFHPASKEYRVLYVCVEGASFKFIVHGLNTKSSTKIATSSSYPPCGYKLPTILNGALHWIIDDDACKDILGASTRCSNAIVMFNMDTEDSCTMPHPGGQCNLRTDHFKRMGLMEFEGRLCLSDSSSGKEIVIWILADYGKQFWVRRHVVNIEPVKRFCTVPVGCNCGLEGYIRVIHIHEDAIFLHGCHIDLFLYNLSSGSLRRIGNKFSKNSRALVYPIFHTSSLVSVNIQGIVNFSP